MPKSLNLSLDVDAGELEAICLACEIKAAAVLMDDRAGRSAAVHCGLAVIGTIGLLEQAAARGLLDLPMLPLNVTGFEDIQGDQPAM
jgi:predicted nucleic acid-binding protein